VRVFAVVVFSTCQALPSFMLRLLRGPAWFTHPKCSGVLNLAS
jgi:hypothetical protein